MKFLPKIIPVVLSAFISVESFAARQSAKMESIPNEVSTRLATETDIIDTTLYKPENGASIDERESNFTEAAGQPLEENLDENEPSATATRRRKALGALRPALTQDGSVAFDQGKFSTDDYRDAIAELVGVHQSLLTQAGKHPGFRRDQAINALRQGETAPRTDSSGLSSIFANTFHSLVRAGLNQVAPFEAKILGHAADLYSFLSGANNRYRREQAMTMTEKSAAEIIAQWEKRARTLLRREIKSHQTAPSATRTSSQKKFSTSAESSSGN